MFAWSVNRVKPKMKATYTRKKLHNPPQQTDKAKSVAPPTETITMLGEVDNDYDDDGDSIDIDSLDLALPSETGSKIQPLDNTMTASGEPSQLVDESTARAGTAKVLHQTATTNREPSQNNEAEDDEKDDKNEDDSGELYDVECFMADDFRKLPGMDSMQTVLLTKWAGFDKVSELTWEPESRMRKDVPHIVEAYYKQKVTGPSSNRPQEVTKTPRRRPTKGTSGSLSQPPKDSNTPRGRGRPRMNSNTLPGSSARVTKPSRGRHPKQGSTPRGRDRPRKVVKGEEKTEPKAGRGRRGRLPKNQPSEAVKK